MRKLFVMGVAAVLSGQTLPPAATPKVDYEKQVQPILAEKCYSCHGLRVQQGGLRLDRRQNALRGGDYGPVILPGNSAGSKLIRRVVNGDGGLQMPPTGPLSNEEIAVLRAWIDQGAEFRIEVEEESRKATDPHVGALISAIRAHAEDQVRSRLTADPRLVNGRDAAGSTPLQHAAGFGTRDTMTFLLDRGADVNAGNQYKSTPLFWALHDEAKVRLLIGRGASLSGSTVDGRTPAYQAALMGNSLSVLRFLLERGANPNAKTAIGMTPLMAAASRGDLEMLRLLVDHKADVRAANAAGVTALMLAAESGSPGAVRFLLAKGADAKALTKKSETALAFAATAGVAESVRLLLEAGSDVQVQDIRGYSALLYAAGSDTLPVEVVQLLLAKGADPNAKGDGETAQMLAAKRGDSDVARLLGVPELERKKLGVALPPVAPARERSLAEAVQPALALLERQSHTFIRIGACNSCHAQDLPSAAAAIARDRKLPAPKLIPQLPQHMHANSAERLMDLNTIGPFGPAWELFDFGANRVPRDEYTDAAVHYLKVLQAPAGNWFARESRRPPMIAGEIQQTALAVYAIRHYGRVEDQEENSAAITRAAAWLESAKPVTNQDRAFRLLGLSWSQGNPTVIGSAVKDLASRQRIDGGWSQLATMGSDAYATGQALYALQTAGRMPASDPVYRKGVQYLLRTQAADGSWHVRSRSIWFQPYFESSFPYGPDQWISTAGTAWAVMALSLANEPPRISRNVDRGRPSGTIATGNSAQPDQR